MKEILKDWEQNSKKKEDKNFRFIRSLKLKDERKVDSFARESHEEAFRKIDCLQCGNCCKISKPVIEEKDIEGIAKFLNETKKEIKNKYLEKDEDNDWRFNALPCPFLNLNNNHCKIYNARPKDCQEFPHTNKKGFASRSYMHSHNTTACPATYYIVERLKSLTR